MRLVRFVMAGFALLAAWTGTPSYGADPNPADTRGNDPADAADSVKRFVLMDSTGRDTDPGQAAVLLDKVTGELIILADPGDGKGLREISRVRTDLFNVHVSILPVARNRYYVVADYSYDPLGNETVDVQVIDPVTHETRLSAWSRLAPLIEDINGDGVAELVLFFDTEDFDHPEAPVWPVIHALDQDGMLRRPPPEDPAYRTFMEGVETQFEEFVPRLEADCETLATTQHGCPQWLNDDIAKARKQLQDIRRVLGR